MPNLLWRGRRALRSVDGTYRAPEGFRIRVPENDYFGWMMAWGYFAPELRTLLRRYLREGDVYVDVGAHIGYLALSAGALVGESGRVLAFDAEPRAARMLRQNVALNPRLNVIPVEVAVASEPGEIEFVVAEQLGWSTAVSAWAGVGEHAKVRVAADTLDNLCARHLQPNQLPRLVKIDVEGYEPQVLKGASRLLRSRQTAWIVEVHPEALAANGSNFDELFNLFSGTGHDMYWIHSPRSPIWHGQSARLERILSPDHFAARNGDIFAVPSAA